MSKISLTSSDAVGGDSLGGTKIVRESVLSGVKRARICSAVWALRVARRGVGEWSGMLLWRPEGTKGLEVDVMMDFLRDSITDGKLPGPGLGVGGRTCKKEFEMTCFERTLCSPQPLLQNSPIDSTMVNLLVE